LRSTLIPSECSSATKTLPPTEVASWGWVPTFVAVTTPPGRTTISSFADSAGTRIVFAAGS
jgi:hypothetical protein